MRSVGEYQLDDDPGRIDREALWAFLGAQAYWGRWRSRADVERQLDSAWRVVGCYDVDGHLVGFARAVSDGTSFAYLADVYVLATCRGRGLGQALVHEMIEEGAGAGFRWLLNTADAQGLYRKFGFGEPDSSMMERRGTR